jgi:hypothetical protein
MQRMDGRRTATKPSAALPDALEEQLASVIEQPGATIATPRGVRRRKGADTSIPKAIVASESMVDEVKELDHSAITKLVKTKGDGRSYAIAVKKGEHERSPFVVSLRTVSLHPTAAAPEERPNLAEAFAPASRLVGSSAPVHAYASVSADLQAEHDPWSVHAQFTPASFEESYRSVYGSFDRLRSFVGGIAVSIRRAFIRVETTERDAVEGLETALDISPVRFSFARAVVGFCALALIVTLPANAVALYRSVADQKALATDAGQAAVADALSAADAGSITASADALKNASSRFREADADLTQSSALAIAAASVLPKTYRSAKALLEVGDKASEAGRLLALGFNKVFDDQGRRLDERLDVMGAYARSALQLLSDASKAAATVDPSSIPESQRANATALLAKLNDSSQAVQEFSTLSDALSVMAGRDQLRKYLVIFQNQTELRPTGGFMGSLAEVTVDRGAIADVRVPPGGTYDLQGQLLARVEPPKPLQLVNALWQFQDVNWSPDFPTSAKKVQWFWGKARQSSVDGVIAINATFVEKLLDITGPIDMPEYGKTIDSSNFLLETQKAVEIDYDKTANTPKKFVGDLMAKLMDHVKGFTKEDWLKVLALTSQSLETKDIQVAFNNPDEEALAERSDWNGRIKPTSGDALALIEANIGGQKTDGSIEEHVMHRATIADDGSIQDTVTLVRTHHGVKGEMFKGVRNVSYLRVYVPQGSTLVSANGFNTPDTKFFQATDTTAVPDPDISLVESSAIDGGNGVTIETEGDRTVFGGWMQLDPGQTQKITLSYKLPMTASDMLAKLEASPDQPSSSNSRGAYLLLLTSQSGKTDRTYQTSVDVPPDWTISWSRFASTTESGLTDAGTWDRDHVVAALFTPSNGQAQSTSAGN